MTDPIEVAPISVVIPTYNRVRLVQEAICSVLAQTRPPAEIVVVDDGSSDGTTTVLTNRFANSKIPVRVITQENRGQSHARNQGIKRSNFEIVAFLDSDNTWNPDKLNLQLDFMGQNQYRFTFTSYIAFGRDPTHEVCLPHWEPDPLSVLEALFFGCCINTSTVISDKKILTDSGLFDTACEPCEDHDLWLRIAASGQRIGYLAMPLSKYRIHSLAVSAQPIVVAKSTEVLFRKFFQENDLPTNVRKRRRRQMARCRLNVACAFAELGRFPSTVNQLAMAALTRPLSVRAGWIGVAAKAIPRFKLSIKNRKVLNS